MNLPSTKSMFSTKHLMSQCHQNSVIVFAIYLENEAISQELPFLKNVLKLSILPIESVFNHWIPCGAKS